MELTGDLWSELCMGFFVLCCIVGNDTSDGADDDEWGQLVTEKFVLLIELGKVDV